MSMFVAVWDVSFVVLYCLFLLAGALRDLGLAFAGSAVTDSGIREC